MLINFKNLQKKKLKNQHFDKKFVIQHNSISIN